MVHIDDPAPSKLQRSYIAVVMIWLDTEAIWLKVTIITTLTTRKEIDGLII